MANEPTPTPRATQEEAVVRYVNLKLAALGEPISEATADPAFMELAGPLLANYRQKDRVLGFPLPPVDQRIQEFLDHYLEDGLPRGRAAPARPHLHPRPARPGARALPAGRRRHLLVALPQLLPRRAGRAAQPAQRPPHHPGHLPRRRGRPARARRQEGRAPGRLRRACWRPPSSRPTRRSRLPFTAGQPQPARVLRLAAAAAAGLPRHRPRSAPSTMEIRFFAPGEPGQQPRLRREHLRQRRRSLPAARTTPRSTSTTGPATPAA